MVEREKERVTRDQRHCRQPELAPGLEGRLHMQREKERGQEREREKYRKRVVSIVAKGLLSMHYRSSDESISSPGRSPPIKWRHEPSTCLLRARRFNFFLFFAFVFLFSIPPFISLLWRHISSLIYWTTMGPQRKEEKGIQFTRTKKKLDSLVKNRITLYQPIMTLINISQYSSIVRWFKWLWAFAKVLIKLLINKQLYIN